MNDDELERRISESLKSQARQAEDLFIQSGAIDRVSERARAGRRGAGVLSYAMGAAAVVLAIGVGLWAASQVPRNGAGTAPSASIASPSTIPSAESPSPSPTDATPAPTPTGPSPDGSVVEDMFEVVGGELVAYSEPSVGSSVVDQVAEGRAVWVAGEMSVEGQSWLRIQFASFDGQVQDVFAWTANEDQLRPIELVCPADAEVASLGAMSAQEHLDCFGDADLTLVGFAVQRSGVGSSYTGTPSWLAESPSVALRGRDAPEADTGILALHVDPAGGLTIPIDDWVEVVGHFDDPASSSCQRQPAVEGLSIETPDEQTHFCRQRFVVTQVRVIDPPAFPTPAPDARQGESGA